MTWTPSIPHRLEASAIPLALKHAATFLAKGERLTVRRYNGIRTARDRHWPHTKTILQHYGNWKAACTAAGVS